MKRAWFWSLLFGLLLGVGLGIVVATRWIQPAVPTGTALLREFSWPAVAAQAGQTNWLVIEDRLN